MNRRMRMEMLALAALAACGGPPPAERAPGPAPSGDVIEATVVSGTPVIHGLLGARERLGLTSGQVTALDSIATAWSASRQALARELRETATPAVTLQHIARNNLAANQAVEAVLTPEQRRTVCEMEAEQRTARGEPVGAARVRGEAPPAAPSGWPWCARAPAAQPAP